MIWPEPVPPVWHQMRYAVELVPPPLSLFDTFSNGTPLQLSARMPTLGFVVRFRTLELVFGVPVSHVTGSPGSHPAATGPTMWAPPVTLNHGVVDPTAVPGPSAPGKSTAGTPSLPKPSCTKGAHWLAGLDDRA